MKAHGNYREHGFSHVRRGNKKRAGVSRPCMDKLESRRLLSAGVTAVLADGVLTVTGTDNADVIKLAANGSNINVKTLGISLSKFPTAQVQSVVILGGAGADSITVGAGVPAADIQGGVGADTIVTANGHDTLQGGAGADSLSASAGHNQIAGGNGNDTLTAKGRDNSLGGGAGNDLLTDLTGSSGDTLQGGAGNDTAEGNVSTDTVSGVEETVASLSTFDLSSTSPIASNGVTFTPAASFGYDPSVPNVRADYGAATTTPFLSSNDSSLDNPVAVSPSGSVALPGTFNISANGSNNTLAYTFDMFPAAVTYKYLSFDIMVDPSGALDANGGYGYFSVATRDGTYTSNNITTGSLTGGGFELGVSYSPVQTAGKWYHITATLDSTDDSVRAITFQDYGGSGQNLTGNETIYIDNLALGN
jgi:RTX calcium-binding nonapeptide repeat (4 copies)